MAPDLTREPPRSPRDRVGLYVILGRTIDKCRASLAGTLAGYHSDSPLDHLLLDWKGIGWLPFRTEIVAGSTDEDVVRFLNENGAPKTPEDVIAWSARMEEYRPFENPGQREWFVEACAALGLDPRTTTLFDYLEEDDRRSFGIAA